MQAVKIQSEEIFSPRIRAMPASEKAPVKAIASQIKNDAKFFFIFRRVFPLTDWPLSLWDSAMRHESRPALQGSSSHMLIGHMEKVLKKNKSKSHG